MLPAPALAIAGAGWRTGRARLVAGRDTPPNRRRQAGIPFDAGHAFALPDAAIREFPASCPLRPDAGRPATAASAVVDNA